MTTVVKAEPNEDDLFDFTPDGGGGLSPAAEKKQATKARAKEEREAFREQRRRDELRPALAVSPATPEPTKVSTKILAVLAPRVPTVPKAFGTDADPLQIDPELVRAAPGEEYTVVALSNILADYAWNIRSGAWTSPGASPVPDEEDSAPGMDHFSAFCANIATHGLKEPVDVRKLPNAKPGEPAYFLFNGFRRFTAVRRLDSLGIDVPGLDKGTIKVRVLDVDEKGARLSNVMDNVLHDQISAADRAWGIGQLSKLGFTVPQIRNALGKSQTYVNSLHRIQTKLPESVTTAWRNGTDLQGRGLIQLSVDQMKAIAARPPDEMEDEYTRLVHEKTDTPMIEEDGRQWMVSARKNVEKIGHLLGIFARDDLFVPFNPKKGDTLELWLTMLEVCEVKYHGKVTPNKRQRESLAKSMMRAYQNTRDSVDEEETLDDS